MVGVILMIYLPFADVSMNLLTIFVIGLMIGILGGVFGTLANLVVVPVLSIFGLPVSVSAGTNLGQSFGRASLLIFAGNLNQPALYRVGVVTGIVGLPGVFIGFKLHLFLMNTSIGEIAVNLCYIALLLSAAVALFRQWSFFNRFDYYDDAPFPPFGLSWKYPLAIPGCSGMSHITLLRIALVGFLLGTAAGFLGLGAGALGIPLFMYILGLPMRSAAATDNITMLIIGAGAFFSYAASGRVEFTAVVILLVAVILGNRIGSLLPGDLNFSHVRLAFTVFLAIVAFSTAVSLNDAAFSHLMVSVPGLTICASVTVLSLVPEKFWTGKIARLLKSLK